MFTYLEEMAKVYHAEQQLKATRDRHKRRALRLRRGGRDRAPATLGQPLPPARRELLPT
jgi:hypothetical protein